MRRRKTIRAGSEVGSVIPLSVMTKLAIGCLLSIGCATPAYAQTFLAAADSGACSLPRARNNLIYVRPVSCLSVSGSNLIRLSPVGNRKFQLYSQARCLSSDGIEVSFSACSSSDANWKFDIRYMPFRIQDSYNRCLARMSDRRGDKLILLQCVDTQNQLWTIGQ